MATSSRGRRASVRLFVCCTLCIGIVFVGGGGLGTMCFALQTTNYSLVRPVHSVVHT